MVVTKCRIYLNKSAAKSILSSSNIKGLKWTAKVCKLNTSEILASNRKLTPYIVSHIVRYFICLIITFIDPKQFHRKIKRKWMNEWITVLHGLRHSITIISAWDISYCWKIYIGELVNSVYCNISRSHIYTSPI